MIVKIFICGFIVFAATSGFYFGQDIHLKEQLQIYEGLRNTSAIIFGVMGAWLAILHPDVLKNIFIKEKGNISSKDRETIKLLLAPIVISTFVLLIVLVVPLLVAIGKTISYFTQHAKIFRGVSFALLIFLTVIQIYTLILSLVPSDMLQRILQKKEVEENIKKGMFSNTRKKIG